MSRKSDNKEKRHGSDADSDDSVEGDHVGDDSADELLKTIENGTLVRVLYVCMCVCEREYVRICVRS